MAAKSNEPQAKTSSPAAPRTPWFDETTRAPLIADYAERLDSFLSTMADGVVDQTELDAQEARLVKLMQAVEPLLDPSLHAKVTELLCELTAYDIMRAIHTMQATRPKAVFRG